MSNIVYDVTFKKAVFFADIIVIWGETPRNAVQYRLLPWLCQVRLKRWCVSATVCSVTSRMNITSYSPL